MIVLINGEMQQLRICVVNDSATITTNVGTKSK